MDRSVSVRSYRYDAVRVRFIAIGRETNRNTTTSGWRTSEFFLYKGLKALAAYQVALMLPFFRGSHNYIRDRDK